jgi:hypothetical protein
MGYREIEVKDPAARTKKVCAVQRRMRIYTVSGLPRFQEMAHEAKAVYKIGKLAACELR